MTRIVHCFAVWGLFDLVDMAHDEWVSVGNFFPHLTVRFLFSLPHPTASPPTSSSLPLSHIQRDTHRKIHIERYTERHVQRDTRRETHAQRERHIERDTQTQTQRE